MLVSSSCSSSSSSSMLPVSLLSRWSWSTSRFSGLSFEDPGCWRLRLLVAGTSGNSRRPIMYRCWPPRWRYWNDRISTFNFTSLPSRMLTCMASAKPTPSGLFSWSFWRNIFLSSSSGRRSASGVFSRWQSASRSRKPPRSSVGHWMIPSELSSTTTSQQLLRIADAALKSSPVDCDSSVWRMADAMLLSRKRATNGKTLRKRRCADRKKGSWPAGMFATSRRVEEDTMAYNTFRGRTALMLLLTMFAQTTQLSTMNTMSESLSGLHSHGETKAVAATMQLP
mmetsp:Transcript_44146/g.89113  ORF Transcript_44146/g.89113 Transcript_44146/m.89113 type:complete len:282 (+) Transcript_44146:519-1364(+)